MHVCGEEMEGQVNTQQEWNYGEGGASLVMHKIL